MGNICSGEKPEASKKSAFAATDGGDDQAQNPSAHYSAHGSAHPAGDTVDPSAPDGTGAGDLPPSTDAAADQEANRDRLQAEAERQRALREEQARLELIVSTAGRDMVPVGRRDGYYDPAYAAAVGADLHGGGALRTEKVQNEVMSTLVKCPVRGRLPPSALSPGDFGAVLDVLGRGRWEGIELGRRGGHGGCGGEDPNYYFDDVAESFLDSVVPTKEKLFVGVGPIVENLP